MKTRKPITLAERERMKGYRKRWWLPGDEGYSERFMNDNNMPDSPRGRDHRGQPEPQRKDP